ncbi:MAG: hypothetical protein KC442_05180 [Thermomicrobiales bacterium]|nr:hypothetical protein [Thermomicrobiales bacterium]
MGEAQGVAPGSVAPDVETAELEDLAVDEVAPDPEHAAAQVSAVREALLRAYPDVVPELVGGESVEALLASLEPAAAAYQRLAAGFAQRAGAVGGPAGGLAAPMVPAGSAAPITLDVERLPAVEKIRQALAREGMRE